MVKKGLLFCVCKGNCPSFSELDEYEALNEIRHEELVDWAALHPQLCSKDGEEFLKELLRGTEIDELYAGGCAPHMQKKMFRDAFEAVNFDQDKFEPIEIRDMNTEEVIDAVKKAIQE